MIFKKKTYIEVITAFSDDSLSLSLSLKVLSLWSPDNVRRERASVTRLLGGEIPDVMKRVVIFGVASSDDYDDDGRREDRQEQGRGSIACLRL